MLRILLPVVLLACLAFLYLASRKPVELVVNGEQRTLTTSAWTVADLLREAGEDPVEGDEVTPELSSWLGWGETVVLERPAWIVLRDGAEVYVFRSMARSPLALLVEAGISINPGDKILREGKPAHPDSRLPYAPVIALEVIRAVHYVLAIDGQSLEFSSKASSLPQALWEQGVRLRQGDRLEYESLSEEIASVPVELHRGRIVSITAGGERSPIYTTAQTVGHALAEAGFALQGLDYSIPDEHAPLGSRGIRVVRVVEEILVEQEPLPFESEHQPVPDLELDQKQIIQVGEYGLTARRVRVVYEDGHEVDRVVEDEWVAVEPKKRIVGYGTNIVMRTAETPDGVIQYWRSLTMWATSYRPGNTSSTTASGLPLRKGVAAVDRSLIPFYTRMYVPGYGEAVAADIGGGVRGRMIDLGYSDSDYQSWAKWVTVYFLWPPPENIVWMIP
jgi:resuscitation-promoting factor RpfB